MRCHPLLEMQVRVVAAAAAAAEKILPFVCASERTKPFRRHEGAKEGREGARRAFPVCGPSAFLEQRDVWLYSANSVLYAVMGPTPHRDAAMFSVHVQGEVAFFA